MVPGWKKFQIWRPALDDQTNFPLLGTALVYLFTEPNFKLLKCFQILDYVIEKAIRRKRFHIVEENIYQKYHPLDNLIYGNNFSQGCPSLFILSCLNWLSIESCNGRINGCPTKKGLKLLGFIVIKLLNRLLTTSSYTLLEYDSQKKCC